MSIQNIEATVSQARDFPAIGNKKNYLNYFPVISGKYFSYSHDIQSLNGKKTDRSVAYLEKTFNSVADAFLNVYLVTCVATPLIALTCINRLSWPFALPAALTAGAIVLGAVNYSGLIDSIIAATERQ
ncbi:MAG: hypothetical protein S4CHLAM7_12910 [Chlamydiae bacterium]|nr:hypothetical protein [Chlamydiota bacterium]